MSIVFLKKFFSILRLSIFGLLLIIFIAPEWPALQGERRQIEGIVNQRYFDFVVWGAGAISAKVEAWLTAGQTYIDEEEQKQLVLEYLELLHQVRRHEAEVTNIYADPTIVDQDALARPLQQEIDRSRTELARRQPVVEAIVQDQVANVLADHGFEIFGHTWPPVQMRMTRLPYILIVSPREEIRQIYNIPMEHGLSVASREHIEESIFKEVDRSALVVPVGGLGFYPAMIVETTSINFLADVVAHEWAHHWLTLHPLGLSYAADPALRTINETVASIVGTEIGKLVIETYYPEFVQEDPPPATSNDSLDPDQPPTFDYNSEMGITRARVDELLANGQVEEAEAYMAQRQQLFWDNGYGNRVRKLNQAFFAFYGAYADTPGAQGQDPIGPTVLEIRENSSSLHSFMDKISTVTSVEDLLALRLETDSQR